LRRFAVLSPWPHPVAEGGWLQPDWPVPATVRSLVTTRNGGASRGPFASFNIADHVGDEPSAVVTNRARLARRLDGAGRLLWLRQVHGCAVVHGDDWRPGVAADAAWIDRPGTVCVVQTADCLPVLFSDRDGHRVAAAHAGWRGLLGGVLEATVAAFGVGPERLLAWLGPAIGAFAYEVGDEVRSAFVADDPAGNAAFSAGRPGHWHADLYRLARQRLARCGVTAVYGGGCCTYDEPERFFSYRRDGITGRMATLVWIDATR